MKQKFFENMLTHELLQEPKKETKEGRTPRENTLAKLEVDHPQLINFLNEHNPLKKGFAYEEARLWRDRERAFRDIFPLQQSIYSRLSKEGIDLVLERWRTGITKNIIQYQTELNPNQTITEEELLNVFVEPLLVLTRKLLEGSSLAFFHDYLTLAVSCNAAKFTTDINAEAKKILLSHYTSQIRKGTFNDHLLEYKRLKYKPLDDHLSKVLLGESVLSEFKDVLEKLDVYLSVSELDFEDVLKKAEERFTYFFKELEAEIKFYQDEILPLKETEEYKTNKQQKRSIERKIAYAERKIQESKYQIRSSLECVIKVL